MLEVRAVKPYLTLRSNPATLTTGSDLVTVVSRQVLAVETNTVDANDSHVLYTVVRDPVHGLVEVLADRQTRRFSLDDVGRGAVVYRRNVSVESSSVSRDQFIIVVRLDDLQTTGIVDVDLLERRPSTTDRGPPRLHVIGSMTATVDQLDDVALTADHISVDVTSLPVPAVRYDVTAEPRHGVLLLSGVDGGAPVRTFTQADVNAGRVIYRHRDVSSVEDSFRFRVRHLDDVTGLVSDELEFVIDVVESVIPLTASNLTVIEGQSTFVDANTLVLGDQYRQSSDDVVFTVLTQPSHGRLEAADRPGVHLTQFLASQLAVDKLRYVQVNR